jgi:hypothetical protein
VASAASAQAATTPLPAPGAAVGVASVGGGAAESSVDLFYRRTDDGLVQRNGGGDTDLGGILTSGVAAIAIRPGGGVVAKSVYGRGANGGIWFRAWSSTSGAWTAWASLGGRSTGTPAVTCTPAGDSAPVVYTRGLDNVLWRRDATAWVSLGGVIGSDPAGLASVGGTCPAAQDVFALGSDQSVWEWRPSGWTKVGGRSSVAPSATLLPDGGTDLFARGPDGVAYVAHRAAGATAFGAFQKIGTTAYTSTVTGFVDTTVPADRLVIGHRSDGNLWVQSDELGGAADWVVAQVP